MKNREKEIRVNGEDDAVELIATFRVAGMAIDVGGLYISNEPYQW